MGLTLETVILECKDMEPLITFYSEFLGWPVVYQQNEFIRIQSPENGMGIAVQYAEDYIPPVWPSETGKQQMMAHLDFGVSRKELKETVDRAVKLGARVSDTQYGEDEWITMVDPAGHPFCILVWN